MIAYILECIAFQLLFLIIYDFWLKRETFFQWNRVYLIGTYMLSMVLPWIKIEALKTTVPEKFYIYPEFLWENTDAMLVGASMENSGILLSWEEGILYGGMLCASLFFGYKLYRLWRLRRTGLVSHFPKFTRIVVANSQMAFSFFRSIFLGDKVLEREHEGIIQHELVHIEQNHTWDLLFFEFMRIIGWFNPLVYVYQNRVSELHEFIADAQVAKTHKKEQYELLLSQVFQTENISFINQFLKSSLIKKRIVMLQKTKSKGIWQLKYLLLVPLVFAMLIYTSCKNNEDKIPENTVLVSDLASLTAKEEKLVFEKLNKLSGSDENWRLFVKDRNSAMHYRNSKDGSYIKGPDGKKILAKVGIDPKLRMSITFKESRTMRTFLHNDLVGERNNLLKTLEEDNPKIVELNRQIQIFRNDVDDWNAFNGFFPLNEIKEVPEFPGCEASENKLECFKERLARHIEEHLKYPISDQNKRIKGEVLVTFLISEFGHNEIIKIRGGNAVLKAEAERVIRLLPKMKPGSWNGDNYSTYYSIPINFI